MVATLQFGDLKKKKSLRVLIYDPNTGIYKICMVFGNYFFNETFSQLVVTNNSQRECSKCQPCVKGFTYVDSFNPRSLMMLAGLLFLWVLF